MKLNQLVSGDLTLMWHLVFQLEVVKKRVPMAKPSKTSEGCWAKAAKVQSEC
jgi:hypothetical protein